MIDVPLSTRTKVGVLAVWIAIAAFLLPNAIGVEHRLTGQPRVIGSEHERTEALIVQRFDATFLDPLVVVIEGFDPADPGEKGPVLVGLDEAIQKAAPQARILSYPRTLDPLFLGDDGRSAIVLIGGARQGPNRAALTARAIDGVQSFISANAPSLRASWTGDSLINDDLRAMSAREASSAEIRVLPIALLLLLIAFGSVTAGLGPVAVAILTVALARGALTFVDTVTPLSFLSANVATMLGLGLSIDYSLLIVSRFREELTRVDPHSAAVATVKSAGLAVLLAGLGVATALAALLIVPISEVRSIAMAGLIVVVIAVSISVTLLPAVLAVVGSRIDVLSVLRGQIASASETFWRAWGRIVFARPILLLVAGSAPLVALGAHCMNIDINLPRGDWLPASASATAGAHALVRTGHTGLLHTVLVVAEFRTPETISTASGQRALAALHARLADDARVLAVRSIQSFRTDLDADERARNLRGIFTSQDGRTALIAVVPRATLELHQLSPQLVRDLRAAAPVPGIAALRVGGAPAYNADYVGEVTRWFVPVAAIVLGATFLILALGLRSLVLPLKAVALNLLSVAAALGAMAAVFQDGVGAQMLGLPGGYGGVFPVIPILVFAIVFGLSMDYEVFLFHRIVELHRAGAVDFDAMTLGLKATAGVITSAAALMIVVFGAFMLGDFLFMKMLGFSLAAAILIDAVLVRLVLGPALFAIAGRWNWWPLGR